MSAEQVQSEGNAAGASEAGRQDVLSVLSEFELGLESLKALYKQRQEMQVNLEAREAEVRGREEAAAKSSGEIQGLIAKFEQDRREFDARVAEVETGRKHLEEERQDFDQEAERRLGEIENKRRGVEEQGKSLAAHAEQIASQLEDIARRENELAAQREGLAVERRAAESLRGTVASKDAELVRRDAQMRSLGDAVSQLRKDLSAAEELRDGQAEREEQLRDQIKGIESARGEREAALQATADDLRARLEAAGGRGEERRQELERAVIELRTRLDALAAEHAEKERGLQAMIDELKAQAERAAGDPAQPGAGALRGLQEQLEAARGELVIAGEKNRVLGRALDEARANRGDGSSPAAPEPWIFRRKHRLAQYRTAVRRQSEKVSKASEALKKRYEQCEQVLSMRAELFGVRERVVEADRRAQRRRSTTTAAVIMFCIVGTLAIVGTLSWAVSRHIIPATYEAVSVLEADGRGRALNEAELEEWSRFHQQLLNDPIFHAQAAERFKRQGVPDLGEPAALAKLIKESLKTQPLSDGTLTMRLREEGASRTERDLDILTAALAAQANAEQQRRVDGGVTKVKQSAKAGADPVDQTQNLSALVMTVVGALVAGVIGVLAWGRLSRAKSAFEMDSQINDTLNSPKFAKMS